MLNKLKFNIILICMNIFDINVELKEMNLGIILLISFLETNGIFPALNSLSLTKNNIESVRKLIFVYYNIMQFFDLLHIMINEFTIVFVFSGNPLTIYGTCPN